MLMHADSTSRRTEEKLQTVKNTHGKDIEGEIIPLVGDVTKKDSVEYVTATHLS